MAELQPGVTAPDFSLQGNEGIQFSLNEFRGKKVVLYFYAEDGSGTCLQQACSFRDNYAEIRKTGAVVVGISPDDEISHEKFSKKYNLNFILLSDIDRSVMKAYGVWAQKKMFGRTYMGVLRTTFIIDEKGKISHTFTKVRIKSQIEKIMKALSA